MKTSRPRKATRFVAFLRAINVGGHTVKMDRLRALFESLDFENVETFIASGNVVFESAAKGDAVLEARIEKHLAKGLGYEVGTFVRSGEEVAAVAKQQPFDAPAGASLFVMFLKEPLDRGIWKKVRDLRCPTDDFQTKGREVYWLTHRGFSGSTVAPAFGKLCAAGTMRNITTVRKLAAKYGF